ncbi:hypothetical protein [Streptomyces sp. CAU 1734]|uniref:hypothetical protein n=1 Tax=Streptomyces sp. CAU 1734 TaxID=3140360 RepID=UPI00326127EF
MSWMVTLLATDGRRYAYRVHAPAGALLGDVFWSAFHCHDEGPHPRASDSFDLAEIRHIPAGREHLTIHQH